MIANARGHLRHYLGCGGDTTSSRTRTAANKAAAEEERQERHNAARRAAFATSNVAPDWVLADPDLVLATTETSARHRRRISDQLHKVGWPIPSAWPSTSPTRARARAGGAGRSSCSTVAATRQLDVVDRLREAEPQPIRATATPGRPSASARTMTTTNRTGLRQRC